MAADTIRKKKEFEKILSSGRSGHGVFLRVKCLDNNLGVSRVGLVVSTKVSRSAVERNRIRRRLKAILRPMLPGLKRPVDLVFLVQTAAKDKKSQELKIDVERMLRFLRLI